MVVVMVAVLLLLMLLMLRLLLRVVERRVINQSNTCSCHDDRPDGTSSGDREAMSQSCNRRKEKTRHSNGSAGQ